MNVIFAFVVLCLGGCRSVEHDATASVVSSPSVLAQRVNAIDDPIARMAMLDTMLSEDPAVAVEMCRHLNGHDERSQCFQVAHRPHLWVDRYMRPLASRPRPDAHTPSFSQVQPEPCPDCRTPFAVIRAAGDHAKRGDARMAAGICKGLSDTRWSDECMFHAAEQCVHDLRSPGYADAVGLCTASASFSSACLMHIHTFPQMQSPLTTEKSDWEPVIQYAETIRAFWSERDPGFGDLAEGQLWSVTLVNAYFQSRDISGEPLDFLPASAVPHVHSAVALRLATDGMFEGMDLATASASLDTALERRVGTTRRQRPKMIPLDPASIWDTSSDKVGMIPYLNTGLRQHHSEPTTDRLLALLEAVARRPRLDRAWIPQARAHPSEAVQQTAQQLHRLRDPHDPSRGRRSPSQIDRGRRSHR
ncbi:MAG: hypothetical protein AAFV53_24265 [Myxococcota bacterium]